jgi:hypothetical protein
MRGMLLPGLGILAQGELQQPMNGLGAGLKTVGKVEVLKLFQKLLFQAQVYKRRQRFPMHRPGGKWPFPTMPRYMNACLC